MLLAACCATLGFATAAAQQVRAKIRMKRRISDLSQTGRARHRPEQGSFGPARPQPGVERGNSSALDPGRRRPAAKLPPRKPARKPPDAGGWIYGRHAVAAALANPHRHWRRLAVLIGQEAEARALIASAKAAHRGEGERLEILDRQGFAAILPAAAVHQGLALEAEPLTEPDLDGLLRAAGPSIILVLDQLSDPHNVGAVLRSAAAFGALAVLVPEHGAAPIGGALAKAASGALERVPLVRAVNLNRGLERLKQSGFWICGLDEAAPKALAELELGERVAIVLGSEGSGLRRLVREHCDFLARLPTLPEQPTLNVSNAAAIALYELVRGRAGGKR